MGSTCVLAEDSYKITINRESTDKSAHTYGAYQIFKGDLDIKTTGEGTSAVTTKTLSNIQWGDNVNSSSVITELKKISAFTSLANDASAATVAKAISDAAMGADSAEAQVLADALNAALNNSSPKGTATIAANATQGTISDLVPGYYLVKDIATVTGEGAQTRYILQVVDNVTVTEKASVPSVSKKVKEKNDTTGSETGWQDAADYDIGDPVPFQLTGTLPSTFADYDTYKVYTFTDTLSAGLSAPSTDDITIKVGDTSVKDHFDITITGDAKAEQTIKISLKNGEDLKKWTAPTLSATSTIVVEYSAVLNDAAVIGTPGNPNKVTLDFTNNPNGEQNGEYGTTPEDKVVVFTYEIKALKVEADGNAKTQAEYDALSDTEKAEYVKVGDKWQKTKELSGAGFTLYKKVPTTVDASGYKAVGTEVKGVTTFEFKGTDAGEYKLVETTVPAGYNKADDQPISVALSDVTGETLTLEKTANVINMAGSTLPSTGGMGTTIFYAIGAILVIGAGVVLVSRRRAN